VRQEVTYKVLVGGTAVAVVARHVGDDVNVGKLAGTGRVDGAGHGSGAVAVDLVQRQGELAAVRDLGQRVAGLGLDGRQVLCRVDGLSLGCGAEVALLEDGDVVLRVAAALGDAESDGLASVVSDGIAEECELMLAACLEAPGTSPSALKGGSTYVILQWAETRDAT
jgi:hypothetical protein